jgi:hypothetical protein
MQNRVVRFSALSKPRQSALSCAVTACKIGRALTCVRCRLHARGYHPGPEGLPGMVESAVHKSRISHSLPTQKLKCANPRLVHRTKEGLFSAIAVFDGRQALRLRHFAGFSPSCETSIMFLLICATSRLSFLLCGYVTPGCSVFIVACMSLILLVHTDEAESASGGHADLKGILWSGAG